MGFLSIFHKNGKADTPEAPRRGRGADPNTAIRNAAIRADRETTPLPDLAARYGVSISYASNICIGLTGPTRASIRKEKIRADRPTMTLREISAKYNVEYSRVSVICADIDGPRELRPDHPPAERTQAMIDRYEAGDSLEAIAQEYGITRERVRQLVEPFGLTTKKKEWRRIARETVQAQESEIREKVRAERQTKIDEGLRLVREGRSINDAARLAGVKPNILGHECKNAGIESKFGRWRNMEPKIARIRELRALGLSWSKIQEHCRAEGHGSCDPSWLSRHTPDLVVGFGVRSPKSVAAPTPNVPKPPREPRVYFDPDSIWTEEKTTRLIELWLSGCSAQQCSDVLGNPPFTRNSIIGKVQRLRTAGLLRQQTNDPDRRLTASTE